MRQLFLFVFLPALLLLSGCANGYRISQVELQQVVDEQLPVSQSIDLVLLRPQLNLDALLLDLGQMQPGQIGVSGQVSLTGIPGVQPVEARLTLFGRPEFVPAEGAVYLRDVDVKSLQVQGEMMTGTPLDLWMTNTALTVVSDLANQFFDQHPIYTLEEGSLARTALQQFGSEVQIKPGELLLTWAL